MLSAHVSPCFRVKEGDTVTVGQCRCEHPKRSLPLRGGLGGGCLRKGIVGVGDECWGLSGCAEIGYCFNTSCSVCQAVLAEGARACSWD
jgi:hypothetical protein